MLEQKLRLHGCAVRRVDEYLRTWCSTQGRTPTRAEQAGIAEKQTERIQKALAELSLHSRSEPTPAPAILLADTGALQTAIYSLYYFQDDSLIAAGLAQARQFNHVFLLRRPEPMLANAPSNQPEAHATQELQPPQDWQRDGPAAALAVEKLLRQTLLENRIAHSVLLVPPWSGALSTLTQLLLSNLPNKVAQNSLSIPTHTAANTTNAPPPAWKWRCNCCDPDAEHTLFFTVSKQSSTKKPTQNGYEPSLPRR